MYAVASLTLCLFSIGVKLFSKNIETTCHGCTYLSIEGLQVNTFDEQHL